MRALVLSGGGAKGAFEAGVVLELAKAGRDYDLVVGVSTGALSALVLGQDSNFLTAAKRLWAHYEAIKGPKDIYKSRSLWGKLRGGLYSLKPLRKKIVAEVARDGFSRTTRVGVVNLETGEFKLVGPMDICFVDYVLASCSFPPYFPPVKIWGRPYMDGGLRNIAPVQAAIDAGATTIDLVLASPSNLDSWKPSGWTWDIAGRAVSIAVNEVYRGDLANGHPVDVQKFEPLPDEYREMWGGEFIGTLEFDPTKIQSAMIYGQAVAQKLLSP